MHHAVNEFKTLSNNPNSHTTSGTYLKIWKTPLSIDFILKSRKLKRDKMIANLSADQINCVSYVNKEAGQIICRFSS